MTILHKLAIALTIFATSTAFAADPPFPSKAIRFIVPAPPGGSTDVITRTLGRLLADDGYQLIIENIPGANGEIGLGKVASAPPDGYVLGMASSTILSLAGQGMFKLKPEAFTNIAVASVDPLMLLVPAKGPATLEAFIDHMKKNPGKVSIAQPSNNNVNHLFAIMTARIAGTDFINVPYPGGARAIADLAGGQLDAAVLKPSESKALIDSGVVRPIGVFADKRLVVYPNVPTFKERGFDVFPYGPTTQLSYVLAPPGMPAPLREKLIAAFRKAIQSSQYEAYAKDSGFEVVDISGREMDKLLTQMQTTFYVIGAKVFK